MQRLQKWTPIMLRNTLWSERNSACRQNGIRVLKFILSWVEPSRVEQQKNPDEKCHVVQILFSIWIWQTIAISYELYDVCLWVSGELMRTKKKSTACHEYLGFYAHFLRLRWVVEQIKSLSNTCKQQSLT